MSGSPRWMCGPIPRSSSQRALYASVEEIFRATRWTRKASNCVLTATSWRRRCPISKSKPGETSPQVFLATQTNDGVFTLRSTLNDDLAADNEASIVSLLPHPVSVLLVTPGNRLLEKALRATPNVQLSTAATLLDDSSAYDVVVLDGVTPATWPTGNILAINVMRTNWFEAAGYGEGPAIVDTRPAHPVMRANVSFDNVHAGEQLWW